MAQKKRKAADIILTGKIYVGFDQPFMDYKQERLKDYCKAVDLQFGGSKKFLAERLESYYKPKPSPPPDPQPSIHHDTSPSPDPENHAQDDISDADPFDMFLQSLKLEHFKDKLIDDGWEDMMTIRLATRDDLKECGLKPGQAAKLLHAAIQDCNTQSTNQSKDNINIQDNKEQKTQSKDDDTKQQYYKAIENRVLMYKLRDTADKSVPWSDFVQGMNNITKRGKYKTIRIGGGKAELEYVLNDWGKSGFRLVYTETRHSAIQREKVSKFGNVKRSGGGNKNEKWVVRASAVAVYEPLNPSEKTRFKEYCDKKKIDMANYVTAWGQDELKKATEIGLLEQRTFQ